MNIFKINNSIILNIYAFIGYLHFLIHIIAILAFRVVYALFLLNYIKWLSVGIVLFLVAIVIEIVSARKIEFGTNKSYINNKNARLYFWCGVSLNTLILLFFLYFFSSAYEMPPIRVISETLKNML